MEIKDLFICDHFSCMRELDIVIYGTGHWGEQAYRLLKKINANIIGVCSTEGEETLFHHYPVLSLKNVRDTYDHASVLIMIASVDYYQDMLKNCEKQEFLKANACSVYAFYRSVYLHCEDSDMPENLRMEIQLNRMANERRMEYYTKLYAFDTMLQAAEDHQILVYQPGKVGSQSIWKSIKQSSTEIHSLVVPFGCPEFSRELLDDYLSKIRGRKIKIITGVREPISRDLSALFQNSDFGLWPFYSVNSNIFWFYGDFLGEGQQELSHSEVMHRCPRWRGTLEESFRDLMEAIMQYRMDEFSWFSYEIKRVFGIDVFREDFDKKEGYGIVRKGDIEIFIYKLEALHHLEDRIGEFLEEKDFRLVPANLSEEKMYHHAYRELKKTIKISKKYFQYYYKDHPAYSHFYSDEEIQTYQKMWEEHVDESM